jgi:hypothetical protein
VSFPSSRSRSHAHRRLHSCWLATQKLSKAEPHRFRYFKSKWDKFADSNTDDIQLGGFVPRNYIMGSHVLFLASFDNNDIIMSQFRRVLQ